MAITYGSVGTYPTSLSQSGSTSMAVPYPSGIVAGDALILCAANSAPDPWNTPAGWTLKEFADSVPASGGDLAAYVWTKTATGSESGTLTVTHTANSIISGCIIRYSGVGVSPFGDSSVSTVGAESTTSPTAGTLSPAPGGTDLVVRFYVWGQRASVATDTITNPGGTWTTRLNQVTANAAGFNSGIVVADKVAGTDNQTLTATQTGGWLVVDVDMIAAAATSVGPPYPGLLVSRLRPYFG